MYGRALRPDFGVPAVTDPFLDLSKILGNIGNQAATMAEARDLKALRQSQESRASAQDAREADKLSFDKIMRTKDAELASAKDIRDAELQKQNIENAKVLAGYSKNRETREAAEEARKVSEEKRLIEKLGKEDKVVADKEQYNRLMANPSADLIKTNDGGLMNVFSSDPSNFTSPVVQGIFNKQLSGGKVTPEEQRLVDEHFNKLSSLAQNVYATKPEDKVTSIAQMLPNNTYAQDQAATANIAINIAKNNELAKLQEQKTSLLSGATFNSDGTVKSLNSPKTSSDFTYKELSPNSKLSDKHKAMVTKIAADKNVNMSADTVANLMNDAISKGIFFDSDVDAEKLKALAIQLKNNSIANNSTTNMHALANIEARIDELKKGTSPDYSSDLNALKGLSLPAAQTTNSSVLSSRQIPSSTSSKSDVVPSVADIQSRIDLIQSKGPYMSKSEAIESGKELQTLGKALLAAKETSFNSTIKAMDKDIEDKTKLLKNAISSNEVSILGKELKALKAKKERLENEYNDSKPNY